MEFIVGVKEVHGVFVWELSPLGTVIELQVVVGYAPAVCK